MKRHLYGIFLFLLILNGSFLAYQYRSIYKDEPKAIDQALIDPERPADSGIPKRPDRNLSDFNPEFIDLPNFEDFYSDEESPLPIGELTGVFADGVYRNDEVVAKTSQEWLVLTKSGNKYDLKKAKANVKQLKTTSWPGDVPDAKLTFNLKDRTLFAIRNIKHVKPGQVTTLYADSFALEDSSRLAISDRFEREYTLKNKKVVLRVAYGITKDQTKAAVLLLESAGKKQILKQIYFTPESENIFGDLYWVGDLDNDGKLDLYFDQFNEKGFTGFDLYLSSEAKEDNLVGLAAFFGAAGC